MQAVITYAKQQYVSPLHKYILLPHTNTFHGHRQIFNSCTQTALSAAKKLKFMFEAECILYKVDVPIKTNSYLNQYAMQKCKLDLSKDFARDDKMPHFGRFCGVCSARVCFCLPYVARGASSGLVWRSPPYGQLQKFTSGDICDRLGPTLPEGSFPEINISTKNLSKMCLKT